MVFDLFFAVPVGEILACVIESKKILIIHYVHINEDSIE